MHIVHLVQTFLPSLGGLEWMVHHLSNHLTDRGHQVTVLRPVEAQTPMPAAPADARYAVRTYPFGLRCGEWLERNDRALRRTLAQLDHELHPDVLHAHNPYLPGSAAFRYARRRGTPLVITDHGQCFYHLMGILPVVSWVARSRMLQAMAQAPWITAPGEDGRASIAELNPRGGRHIEILPNGIGVPDDSGRSRWLAAREARGDKPWRILMVGRLHHIKGFDLGVEAMAHPVLRSLPVVLRVIGRGVEALQAQVERAGLADRVALEPPLTGEALWKAYAEADCFWMPSRIEAQGLTKFESMAMGTPVICNDTPGTRERMVHGENGLLFRANDPSDLAVQTARLHADFQLAARIGEAGRMLAQGYRWPAVVEQYERLYQRVLAKPWP